MSHRAEQVEELSLAVKAAAEASEQSQLGKIYEKLVGYDLHEDDPSLGVEDLRGMVNDYVREACYQYEIHVSEVGL